MGSPVHDSKVGLFRDLIGSNVLPFWASGQMETPKPGWYAAVGEFVGWRVQPLSYYDKARIMMDIEAYKVSKGELEFEELNINQKNDIKAMPEIADLLLRSNRRWAEIGTGTQGEIDELRLGQRSIKDYYKNEYIAADAMLRKYMHNPPGPELYDPDTAYTPKEYRARLSELSFARQNDYERLEQEFPEAKKALNEFGKDPDAHVTDIAYNHYSSTVLNGDYDQGGTEHFDWDAFQKKENEWINQWGQEMYRVIQIELERNLTPFQKDLRDGRKLAEGYWNIGKFIVSEHLELGVTEPEWAHYMALDPAQRKYIAENNPLYKQLEKAQTKAREKMRRMNVQLDEFLYRWQYTDTLLKTDYEDIEQRKRELRTFIY